MNFFTPVRYSAENIGENIKYLKITVFGGAQLSRMEIKYNEIETGELL